MLRIKRHQNENLPGLALMCREALISSTCVPALQMGTPPSAVSSSRSLCGIRSVQRAPYLRFPSPVHLASPSGSFSFSLPPLLQPLSLAPFIPRYLSQVFPSFMEVLFPCWMTSVAIGGPAPPLGLWVLSLPCFRGSSLLFHLSCPLPSPDVDLAISPNTDTSSAFALQTPRPCSSLPQPCLLHPPFNSNFNPSTSCPQVYTPAYLCIHPPPPFALEEVPFSRPGSSTCDHTSYHLRNPLLLITSTSSPR